MNITHTDIWKFSIPMHPFTIATGTMHFAQNIFLRVHLSNGLYGVGECSAFPMITGETQATCFEMAKEFSALWKNKDAGNIPQRLGELDDFVAFNTTIKSAFDMALYDIASKMDGKPLYAFLGGAIKQIETDLTIGIGSPSGMAQQATEFANKGVRIIKVKLGKRAEEDIERVKLIRQSVGTSIKIRVDANQGWNFDDAVHVLNAIAKYDIEFCEQPMHYRDDHLLPRLRKLSPIKIMADESVYDHHDAQKIIDAEACDYVNIKFAKSGGISEAIKIHDTCSKHGIPCMMGGMLESRIALTAFAHFAMANDNIIFYDMDTCMLGHKEDPVTGGVKYNGYFIETPSMPGIGADADENFLKKCESITI